MNGRFKWSIRRKLFLVLLITLAVNMVVLLVMGSTLFERFYVYNKISELKNSARQLKKQFGSGEDMEAFFAEINKVENRNSIVALLVFSDDGEIGTRYYTRDRFRAQRKEKEDPDPVGSLPEPGQKNGWPHFPDPSPPRPDQALLDALPALGDGMAVSEGEGFRGTHLSLITELDGNTYLYIETPKEYIRSTATLAVRYTTYLSGLILLVSAVGLYLLAGRITKPIRSIQNVADKISRLDFSESCPKAGDDELGALSESINNMARELQANIEKLMQANEVLQSDLLRQQKADRMRRQFVANVSHDFKTPLTLIISYAEALPDAQDAQERREYCETILDEGNKLARMVGQLLRLSQLESGMNQIEPSIFCINELIEQAISKHRILSDKKGLRISHDWEDEFIVLADYHKIEQAITNIYENAVKYAPRDGEIRVRAAACGGKCEVSVYNSGERIPEEVKENLFISFYRADQSRRRDGQSYGLGLAIVKAILEIHRQPFGCENMPGGVRFWFHLDIAELPDEERAAPD